MTSSFRIELEQVVEEAEEEGADQEENQVAAS